jgi:hypothetical protein
MQYKQGTGACNLIGRSDVLCMFERDKYAKVFLARFGLALYQLLLNLDLSKCHMYEGSALVASEGNESVPSFYSSRK